MGFLHVLTGRFESIDVARLYTQARWEPEPDESASDEEYAAWEDRNPTWPMRVELDIYLDEDAVETVDGDDRYVYLSQQFLRPTEAESIAAVAAADNVLVLIFDAALGGFHSERLMRSTSKLTYHGRFETRH